MTQITYINWDGKPLDVSVDDALKGSLSVLEWAYKSYKDDEMVYACSFGVEGIVLIDLIYKVNPEAQIVFLDTDFHFKETYDLIEQVKRAYPSLNIKIQKPDLTPEAQAELYGEALWKRRPDQCCHIRKVDPLQKALSGRKAWISGLRREQSETRRHVAFLNRDHKFQSLKICPLIHWTEEDVWNYVKANHLAYNPLHDKGYPSIGCEYCTNSVTAGGDPRAGRWAAFEKTECGLHER
jgi:phosphoadenosine phosphosulfate reductase